MANMDLTQRNLYERVELSVPSTGVRVRSGRRLGVAVVALAALLAILAYAAVATTREWAQAVVLAGILLTAAGAAIALDPRRP